MEAQEWEKVGIAALLFSLLEKILLSFSRQLLTKQHEVLKNVNESRMRLYEDVDKNLQDIEKSNEKLRSDIKADKEKIKMYERNQNMYSQVIFGVPEKRTHKFQTVRANRATNQS